MKDHFTYYYLYRQVNRLKRNFVEALCSWKDYLFFYHLLYKKYNLNRSGKNAPLDDGWKGLKVMRLGLVVESL